MIFGQKRRYRGALGGYASALGALGYGDSSADDMAAAMAAAGTTAGSADPLVDVSLSNTPLIGMNYEDQQVQQIGSEQAGTVGTVIENTSTGQNVSTTYTHPTQANAQGQTGQTSIWQDIAAGVGAGVVGTANAMGVGAGAKKGAPAKPGTAAQPASSNTLWIVGGVLGAIGLLGTMYFMGSSRRAPAHAYHGHGIKMLAGHRRRRRTRRRR